MAGIDLGDAWADEVWESGVWADGVWEGQEAAGGGGGPFTSGSENRQHRLHFGFRTIIFFLLLGL